MFHSGFHDGVLGFFWRGRIQYPFQKYYFSEIWMSITGSYRADLAGGLSHP